MESLVKRFGGVQALGGMDLAVDAGEFRAIIGPNGAGKSTFFNTLTGLVRPDSGRVAFEGRDITGEPPHRVARRGVARTFQIAECLPRSDCARERAGRADRARAALLELVAAGARVRR